MIKHLAAFFLACSALHAGAAVPTVGAGGEHTLALRSDGTLFAVGEDSTGQLGSGGKIQSAVPVAIPGLGPIASIKAGDNHVLAVRPDGSVLAWGRNQSGQLGDGTTIDRSLPVRVRGLGGVVSVAAGLVYSLAVKGDGTVWTWGHAPALGNDSTFNSVPVRVQGLVDIVAVEASSSHTLALKRDGTIWSFGLNADGQLGDGTTNYRFTPAAVPGLTAIVAIAAGESSSLALGQDGRLWTWGRGFGPSPVQVLTDVTAVAAGGSNRLALKTDGTVWASGDQLRPSGGGIVAGLSGAVAISVGYWHALVLKQDGTVWAWGYNYYGNLGNGVIDQIFPPIQYASPAQVPNLAGVTAIEAGQFTSIARKADGSVWIWGSNLHGEFADARVTNRSVPERVIGSHVFASMAGGRDYSLGVNQAGTVWAWGDNLYGQLGDGTHTFRAEPTQVAGLTAIVAVSAGYYHALALKSDGTVYAWGWNVSGQLGNGSSDFGQNTPAPVPGLTGVTAIAAGGWYGHSMALRQDGTVWVWGSNTSGQLGDGTIADKQSPQQVPGLANVVAIAAGYFYSAALKADGSVWAWGANDSGQLGSVSPTLCPRFSATATMPCTRSPTRVDGISSGVTAISAGQDHMLALTVDGAVWAWGSNRRGQLGDGSLTSRPAPLRTALPLPATRISAGIEHSVAMTAGGSAWAWGGNLKGQLGDGTYVLRTRPVVMVSERAAGRLDTNDWYLDLQPAAPDTIPSTSTPRVLTDARLSTSNSQASLAAEVKYAQRHLGTNVSVFTLALVPPEFFNLVKSAPGEAARARAQVKAGEPLVLAQLTPAGWSAVVGGQLIPYAQAVASAAGSAANILGGVSTTPLQGARFCIGYGASAQSMLSEETLREVLVLEGAAATASGLPCVLTGVYVDGPATSIAGAAATFNASVVGVQPTGAVQFRDGAGPLLPPVSLTASNAAVAKAAVTTSSLAAGEHSIGASYSGDTQNVARDAVIPLRHEVRTAAPGTSIVALSGPASSELANTVAFTARVTGATPTGTVRFRTGAVDLGSLEPVVGGLATLRTAALAAGTHSISAMYSGDSANAASSSGALTHRVFEVLNSSVALSVPETTVAFGAPVVITATVTGSNPTGNVVVRDEATVLATASLANGSASVTLSDLAAGLHWVTATYSGDGANQPVTSVPVAVAVRAPAQAPAANPPRLANIATRMQVLTGDNVLIGGFIIGGSSLKTVVVRARGPSLTALGVPGALGNPVLNLYSGQAVIATNDDHGTAANAAQLQASGFAPSNALESAILITLNPGPYTAIVSGAGGGTGVGLIEVFEVDALTVPLINIATRGQVLTGDNVMIGGFIIQGSGPQTVVVRARGPSLTALGVPGALANPVLQLYSGQRVIASNDNWQAAANAAELQSSGFAPADALESAILITLDPGAYTAIVSGAGGTTGVGIIEVFAR